VHSGDFKGAVDLAHQASLAILKQGRVSVASQLLTVMSTVLRETHLEETDDILAKIKELHDTFTTVMEGKTGDETFRLHRLQRDWLRRCVQWSSELGNIRFGHQDLQALLAQQSWIMVSTQADSMAKPNEEEDELMELKCDAVTHMALAEKPMEIIAWLKTLPAPTNKQTKSGHTCPPADRDALFTRAVLCLCAIENLRDAYTLVTAYINEVEERDTATLTKSYTSKDDGKAQSHAIFASMLLRTCEKDARTGPLFQWLLRSFKRELDGLYKAKIVQSYTTKIGKIYFNIQPPPSMLNMMENMMGMMGGGGGAGGMNPAMMQALASQMGNM